MAFSNLDLIQMSPILETDLAENLKPRITDLSDVVVVNSRNKIVMTNSVQEKGPDQIQLCGY